LLSASKQQDKTLTRQTAKMGLSFGKSQIAWRKLARVSLLLLLLTQQAWGGLICHCQPAEAAQLATQMSHACCPASRHCASTEDTEYAGDSESPHSEKAEPAKALLSSDNLCDTARRRLAACCQAAPQSEPLAMTSVREPEPVANYQAPSASEGQTVQTSIPNRFLQPNRNCPLYLSFSCFLI
jgi:hypothetical protein